MSAVYTERRQVDRWIRGKGTLRGQTFQESRPIRTTAPILSGRHQASQERLTGDSRGVHVGALCDSESAHCRRDGSGVKTR